MVKKRKKRKSKQKYKGLKVVWKILKGIGKAIWFIIKIPYFLYRGVVYLVKGIKHLNKESKKTVEKVKEKKQEKEIKEKRKQIEPVYEEIKVLKKEKGEYSSWEKKIANSDSKIGIILGARGSGKSAFGIKFLENLKAKGVEKNFFAMGFKKNEMPSWIEIVENIKDIKNNSFVLIDEGGVLFSSRSSMSNANKLLSDLIMVARHKNLNILFISQNSSNLDVNIIRQSDFLVLKPSSLLQKDFERKAIQKIYEKTEEDFEKFKEDKGSTFIYSSNFKGFVSNPLPSFWGEELSKSFG